MSDSASTTLPASMRETAATGTLAPEHRKRKSIAGMFTMPHLRKRKIQWDDVDNKEDDSSEQDGHGPSWRMIISKSRSTKSSNGFSHRFANQSTNIVQSPRPLPQSLFAGFDKAVEGYERNISNSVEKITGLIHAEMEQRMQGRDIHGQPLDRPGVPSQSDLQKVEDAFAEAEKPFEDEEMDVEISKPDGKTFLKRVTIGQVLEAYKKLFARQRDNLDKLEQELKKVVEEIEQLFRDIPSETDSGIQLANETLQAEKARLDQEMQAAKKDMETELEEARETERAEKAALKRKMQQFMTSLP